MPAGCEFPFLLSRLEALLEGRSPSPSNLHRFPPLNVRYVRIDVVFRAHHRACHDSSALRSPAQSSSPEVRTTSSTSSQSFSPISRSFPFVLIALSSPRSYLSERIFTVLRYSLVLEILPFGCSPPPPLEVLASFLLRSDHSRAPLCINYTSLPSLTGPDVESTNGAHREGGF